MSNSKIRRFITQISFSGSLRRGISPVTVTERKEHNLFFFWNWLAVNCSLGESRHVRVYWRTAVSACYISDDGLITFVDLLVCNLKGQKAYPHCTCCVEDEWAQDVVFLFISCLLYWCYAAPKNCKGRVKLWALFLTRFLAFGKKQRRKQLSKRF